MSTHTFNSTNVYSSPFTDQHLLSVVNIDIENTVPALKRGSITEPLWVYWSCPIRTGNSIQAARTTGRYTIEALVCDRLGEPESNTEGPMCCGNDLRCYSRSYRQLIKIFQQVIDIIFQPYQQSQKKNLLKKLDLKHLVR